MANSITDTTVLANGVKMPWFGLGVWRVQEGQEVEASVEAALRNGYRSIDTAAVYGNEEGVGNAIKASGVKREDLFVTTKVWNSDRGYESTLAAFEESRRKLQLEYIDLYLIHWPKDKNVETWRALEKLYKDGKVRAIGVSNFKQHHLEEILAVCEVAPMVNQVELHPLHSQPELRAFCKSRNIQIEAWSPLMQGNLDNPTLVGIGAKYGKTAAQVVLRWDIQSGIVTIPKSIREERIRENANIFDFVLSAEDMAAIDALNVNGRIGPDPDHIDF